MIMTETTGLTSKASVCREEAAVMWSGKEYVYAHALLKEKYPEYQTQEGGWKEGDIPIIKITPTSFAKGHKANGKSSKLSAIFPF